MLEYHRDYNLIHLPVQNSPVPAFNSDKNKNIQQIQHVFPRQLLYEIYVYFLIKLNKIIAMVEWHKNLVCGKRSYKENCGVVLKTYNKYLWTIFLYLNWI